MSPRIARINAPALAAMLCLVALAPPALGQSAGRRAVRRESGVTGVELGLEGALSVPRGGRLRWLLQAFEVRGLQDIRPAPDTTITLTTSFDPGETAAEARTDRWGRAALELDVPDDAPASFRAVLRAVTSTGVQRRFELTVETTEPRSLALHLARDTVRPGGLVHVFGRLALAHTGLPVAQEAIRLQLRDESGRPQGAPVRVVTDGSGLFAHRFRLPAELSGSASVEAATGEGDRVLSATRSVSIAEPTTTALLVAVAPAKTLVRPGETVQVAVSVRTAYGRPVSGVQLRLAGARDEDEGARASTDRRGRATVVWRAPGYGSGINDVAVSVGAEREGYGAGSGQARVRVAAQDWEGALAVEGGGLVPSLGGRVWVRVVGADGRPAQAGVPVRLDGPRLPGAGISAATDADGVATLDVEIGPAADEESDRCGGEGATSVSVRIGGPGSSPRTFAACIPLDVDGAVRARVEPPLAGAGSAVTVEIERVRAAARMPVAVTLLHRRGSGLAAVATRVVPAGEARASFELPRDVVGEVVVRARPIASADGQEVRGGTTAIWVVPGEGSSVRARLDGSGSGTALLELLGPSTVPRSAYVVALPLDEARALDERLRQTALGPLGDLRREATEVGPSLVAAALAARVPRDTGASGVLRDGEIVDVPAPESPTSIGLLRDPFRSRARFVTGRLALIFRAIESYVSASVPERIDDVAVRDRRGRFDFNIQILESVAESGDLGGAGATGLGGEPLTIEALRRFDRTFTYDAVARRVTRERLFRLILALRDFVRSNHFDMPWSRLGDPSSWLRGLRGRYVSGLGQVEARHLVDGWGRPFVLQRARGGRARFGFVSPLPGWEVVSPGPDGRAGSGDDIWDPTARVLSSGSPYARAVGEDALVARLHGVELGRATVGMLGSVGLGGYVSGVPSRPSAATEELARRLWSRLPSVFEPELDPLALRRPARPGDGAAGRIVAARGAGGALRVPLGLDEEPRTWGVVAWVWTSRGVPAVGLATATSGAPLIVEGRLPAHLRADEPVTVDLDITNVSDEPRTIHIDAGSRGLVTATPEGDLVIPAGAAARTSLGLVGRGPGRDRLEIVFGDVGGEALRRIAHDVRVNTGRQPVRLRASRGIADGRLETTLEIPRDAARPLGRVVVLAPAGITADPELAAVRLHDPALTAWADTLAGRPLSESQRAALLAAVTPSGGVEGRSPSLSAACAVVALAALGVDDEEAMAALRRATSALGGGPQPEPDQSPDAGVLRSSAAVLAALAPGGVPEVSEEIGRSVDPVARLAAALRPSLRRAIHAFPEEPTLLARAAAALLLADPRDAHGRAMVARAAAHLVDVPGGGARVGSSEAREGALETVTATAALAVAAHQVGDDELARRLLLGALSESHVLARAGGESAFWLLAAAAYGAMGTGAPERVTLRVGWSRQELSLEGGHAVVPLSELEPGRSTRVVVESVGGPALLARVEAVMGRTFSARAGGPLEVELVGDPGDAGGVAAFEILVRAGVDVRTPVVEVQLPAGVEADDALLAVVRGASGVRDAAARRPAFLRAWLHPMAAGTEVVLPLPLRWTARGELTGLGVVAFPEDRPEAMTVLPPRALPLTAGE